MNFARGHKETIGRKLWDCSTATIIASNCVWDGHNWERHGRNEFLCKTPNGNYFIQHRSQWQGERDPMIQPLENVEEAMHHWDMLPQKEMTFAEAFGVEPEIA